MGEMRSESNSRIQSFESSGRSSPTDWYRVRRGHSDNRTLRDHTRRRVDRFVGCSDVPARRQPWNDPGRRRYADWARNHAFNARFYQWLRDISCVLSVVYCHTNATSRLTETQEPRPGRHTADYSTKQLSGALHILHFKSKVAYRKDINPSLLQAWAHRTVET